MMMRVPAIAPPQTLVTFAVPPGVRETVIESTLAVDLKNEFTFFQAR